jgi:hypothetical protein
MSCPMIVNRKWNRAMYYAMRKISRRLWWEQRIEEKIHREIMDMLLYGEGHFRIGF